MDPNWVLKQINHSYCSNAHLYRVLYVFFCFKLNSFFFHRQTRPSLALKQCPWLSGFKDLSPLKSLRTPPPPPPPYAASSLKFFSLFYLTALPIISTPSLLLPLPPPSIQFSTHYLGHRIPSPASGCHGNRFTMLQLN